MILLSWMPARRRKTRSTKPPQPASRTCFIDFLPINICEYDIAKAFAPYGPITNISIPAKIRPQCHHRFAFVQFLSSESQRIAIRKENGRKLFGGRLRVFAAKNDTSQTLSHPKSQPKTHMTPKFIPNYKQPAPKNTSNLDHRSYKDAILNTKSIPKPKTIPKHRPITTSPITNLFQPRITNPYQNVFNLNPRLLGGRVPEYSEIVWKK